jgi:tRNA (guanine-N7-)-methyltransferase
LDNRKDKRVYGRRISRPLTQTRAESLNALLPVFAVPPETLREDHSLAPASLFDKAYNEYWLEIGFGSGEHLSALMRRHPDHAYIGAEPFINGMAAFLKDIQQDNLENIRVHMDDAVMLAGSLAPASLDGIYILNPDPWHKKRHHKRRIVNPDTLEIFARILKPGGQLILSTDVPYLAEWMITHTLRNSDFTWTAQKAEDWSKPPQGWITTAYEVKGAKGAQKMCYLIFTRQQI